ncbi:MAG: lemA [Herminiimonas sp.]|nr:lemA [Herminiimonas sp.]
MIAAIVLFAIVLLVVFWAVGARHRLLGLRAQFTQAYSQINDQVRLRHALIPGLVDKVKSAMEQEPEALAAVVAAHDQAVAANAGIAAHPGDARALRAMIDAEGVLSAVLAVLFALSNDRSDFPVDETMMRLTEQLSGAEKRIAFLRQAYNDAVAEYNRSIDQFPVSAIAKLVSFRKEAPLPSLDTAAERSTVAT